MIFTEAKILENIHLKANYYKLTLNCPEIAKEIKPGQFILIRVTNNLDPLLPRPFGVFRVDKTKENFSVLYAVKGRGTHLLSQKKTGEILTLTGPHGNGFQVNQNSKTICLVAGGFGVSPLLALTKENKDKKIIVIIGGRSKDLIIFEKEFRDLNARVYITTDDGSYGKKGIVIDILDELIKPFDSAQGEKERIDEIFSVGPSLMLKAVSQIAKKSKIPCQISMEERMACGIGVCYSCVCKTKRGFQKICTEGPVFNAKEVEIV